MTLLDVLKNDFRQIRRDLILFTLLAFVVYLGLVLRFLLPWADNYLFEEGILPNASISLFLHDYYPVVISFLNLFTGPVLGGAIFGFLILSEKDNETLKAMLVSPMSPNTFINYRILLTTIISSLIVLFIFNVVNVDRLTFFKQLAITLSAGLTAPIIMLFLVIISDGRVQGLSYSKFISFGGLITLISWWVDEPKQFLFGLFPPYWVSKAYWVALNGNNNWLFYLGIAILYQLAVIYLLRKIFINNVYKSI